MKKWYSGDGNNSDVVMSSRIRLARNLDDAPFPQRMSADIRRNACKKIYASIKNSPYAGEFDLIDLKDKSQAYAYAEKQLISEEFAKNINDASFLLSKSSNVSIMLCEEDHIRLSSMAAGQNLELAYSNADKLDNIFISSLKIAFDENLGFLTAMPTNLGTGMKASVDLHLSAIDEKGMTSRLSSMVGKLGMTLRPLFGGNGSFYRLSNQVSLGISEKNAIDNLNAICNQIVKQERTLREYYSQREDYQDIIYRSLGTLTMARKLSENEFFELISYVRTGISMGFINKSYEEIGLLIQSIGTATIMADAKAEITTDTVAKIRAEIVRDKLK